jgi:hypothetical protein
MQSESELAAAAEKAAIQKDLENWKAIEKELSEKFEQEKREQREQLYKSREVKNRTSPQLTPEGQSMFKPLTPGDYKGIEVRAHHDTNSDKKREIEAAREEYLKIQAAEREKVLEQAKNDKAKAAEQEQQNKSERTLRSGRIREMKMELAQQATETPKIEQTRTGTAAMTNSTEQIQEMIRQRKAEREKERLDREAGLIKERGRDRGREL